MQLTNIPIKYSTIAFWVWSYFPVKGLLIFLFFQQNPAIGTFVSNFIVMCIVACLIPAVYIPSMSHRSCNTTKTSSITCNFIWGFVGWSWISLLWTEVTSISSPLFYAIAMVSELFLVSLFFRKYWSLDIAKASLRGLAFGSTLFAIIALLGSGIGSGGRLGNDSFFHPNSIGYAMAFAIFTGIYLVRTERTRFHYLQLAIFIITMALCFSKTSILATFLSIFISYVIFGKYNFLTKVKIFLFGSILLSPGFYFFYYKFIDYLLIDDGRSMMTLSGRLIIWEQTWKAIKTNFLIGHGFLSFREVGPQIISVRLVHPHNEVLNILFSLGIIGLLIVIAIYFLYTLAIFRVRSNNYAFFQFTFSLVLFSLFRGLTEASVTGIVFPLPLLLLISFWLNNLETTCENFART